MSFFTVSALSAGYGGCDVLRDISFAVEQGTVTGLLGVNGCGKTTLLRAVCGQLPHRGTCILDGQTLEGLPPRALARLCGYLPQRGSIAIDISALDVVLMGFNPCLGVLEQPNQKMRARARTALRQVGLEGRAGDSYLALSEGQKQLCLLARTFVSGAGLLLLDEPEGGLDIAHRRSLIRMLRRWASQKGRAVLAALHDPDLALNCCDSLVLLDGKGAALLDPRRTDISAMEAALSRVYGAVELARCPTRRGEQLTMLMEGEDAPWSQG